MNYQISFTDRHKHIVEITMLLEKIDKPKVILQLPAWRPGRYELANFGKNLFQVSCQNLKGTKLSCQKISKETWEVNSEGETSLVIKYKYYCAQMDAGGSWVDRDLIYLNFINCLLYDTSRLEEKCKVEIEIPSEYKVACGLPVVLGNLYARSFYELIDSPLIASENLKYDNYSIADSNFHIWFHGDLNPDFGKIKDDFYAFTLEQVNSMGGFPEKNYHFLFHILPYRFHHGVEHSKSTVITLGPSEKFNEPAYYHNFLSVSSHELFHAWNICKIRPAEMLPYNLTKENYFRTGFVAEGFTTYYGDLFLVRSCVFHQDEFFEEINQTFKRHFENWGRINYSLADSSFDLWTDGYAAGTPNRKVSIYVKGCVIALMLDLTIITVTNGEKSLDDVLRELWNNFGKPGKGYTEEDIESICTEVGNTSFKEFFNKYIYGTESEVSALSKCLEAVGCELYIQKSEIKAESVYGFRTRDENGKTVVDLIEPESPADYALSKDDLIISVNGIKVANNFNQLLRDFEDSIRLEIKGLFGKSLVELHANGKNYLNQYKIRKINQATENQKALFKKWIKQNW